MTSTSIYTQPFVQKRDIRAFVQTRLQLTEDTLRRKTSSDHSQAAPRIQLLNFMLFRTREG
jgi:hypothetical protein